MNQRFHFYLAELYIQFLFICYDLDCTVLPILICTTVSIINHSVGLNLREIIIIIVNTLIYGWFYALVFTSGNQIIGIEEDVINKPWRLLPRKIITINQAIVRFLIYNMIFIIIAWYMNILTFAIIWQLSSTAYNFLNLHYHWIPKSIFISIAVYTQMTSAWSLVQPITNGIYSWILFLSISALICSNFQDFRDVEGDIKLNRKTLMIVYDITKVKYIVAILSATIPIFFYIYIHLFMSHNLVSNSIFFEMFLSLIMWITCYKLFNSNNKTSYHISWKLLSLYFSLSMLAPLFIKEIV